MKPTDEPIIMTYTTGLRVFPIVVVSFWLSLMIIVGIFANPEPVSGPEGVWAYLLILFLSAGLSWIIFIETIGTRIQIDNEGICVSSLWRPRRVIEWPDVRVVRYSGARDSLGIIGERQKIWINSRVSDKEHWEELLKALYKNVPEDMMHEDIHAEIQQAATRDDFY